MKHLKKGKKFHRRSGQRKALLKGLSANLLLTGRIKTTWAKAKETKPQVEKLITLAKKQTMVALRQVKKSLPEKAANKLYYEIAPLYQARKGGYTRIIRTSMRKVRDGSPLAILELVKTAKGEAEIKQTQADAKTDAKKKKTEKKAIKEDQKETKIDAEENKAGDKEQKENEKGE